MRAADAGDGLLLVSSDEALTLAHLEILGTAESHNQMLAYRLFHTAWHVEIEMGHTFLQDSPHVRTELLAVLAPNLWMTGIHRYLGIRHSITILPHKPMETLFTKRTTLNETHQVVVGLLTEDFFLQQSSAYL